MELWSQKPSLMTSPTEPLSLSSPPSAPGRSPSAARSSRDLPRPLLRPVCIGLCARPAQSALHLRLQGRGGQLRGLGGDARLQVRDQGLHVDISFLSVYPSEQEAPYPPLTYLRSVKAETEDVGGKSMLVATVQPVFM